MSNFALIPQGTTVVSNVIVATQQFIDSAPTEWKAQWAYIIEVDNVPCGPEWVYDPGSGSFYPPASSPPTEEPIVSYDQLLAHQGYEPDVTGVQTTTATNPADVDVSWQEDRLLQVVAITVSNFSVPSSVDFQVVHAVSGDVMNQWGTNIPVPPDGKIDTQLAVAVPIPSGAIVRLKFHGAAGASIFLQYRTWLKSAP
jgi:hypothetical protein